MVGSNQCRSSKCKAAGLYVEQKIIKHGKLEDMSEKELEAKMKQLIEDHKGLIVEADFNVVNENQIESKEEPKQSDSI